MCAHTQHARARVALTSSTSTSGYIHRSDLFKPLTYGSQIRYSINTPTWGVWVNQATKTQVIDMAAETNRALAENVEVPQAQIRGEDRAVLALEGMTCASCAMRIEKGLKKVPGVKDASVNFATEQATVTFDPAQTGIEQMVQKVEAVGYHAIPRVPAPQKSSPEREVMAVAAASAVPQSGIFREDEQSRRKQAEIT